MVSKTEPTTIRYQPKHRKTIKISKPHFLFCAMSSFQGKNLWTFLRFIINQAHLAFVENSQKRSEQRLTENWSDWKTLWVNSQSIPSHSHSSGPVKGHNFSQKAFMFPEIRRTDRSKKCHRAILEKKFSAALFFSCHSFTVLKALQNFFTKKNSFLEEQFWI